MKSIHDDDGNDVSNDDVGHGVGDDVGDVIHDTMMTRGKMSDPTIFQN